MIAESPTDYSEASPLPANWTTGFSYYDGSNGYQFLIPHTANKFHLYCRLIHPQEDLAWIKIATEGDYFPITGGVLKDNAICRNEDNSSLMIIGGKSTDDSAFLQAYGKNNHLYPGVFSLNANIGNGTKSLVGFPDGRLTWNNNDLAGTAITGKSLNNNGYISYTSGLILQWGMITPGDNTSSFGVTLPISFTTVGAYALTAISQDGLSNLRYNPTDINTGIFHFTNSSSNNRVIKFIAIGH